MGFDLFGLGNLGTHDDRLVDHYEDGTLTVDTCRVTDGRKPIETAVAHPDYNDGKWVIVAAYDTVTEARLGHAEWVSKMLTEPLPDKLVDCGNSSISQFIGNLLGDLMEFPRKGGKN